MIDILFRGKRVDNGEWIEGFYGYKIESENHFIMYEELNAHCNSYFVDIEVTPETVVQFTGLTDKNGVKIFEGDVVKMWSKIHIMKFINGCFEFVKFDGRKQNLIDTTECEVIGNIHDNPELP